VCHPFSSDPLCHRKSVRKVCRALVMAGVVPLAPQILFPQFMHENTEREHALACCLRLVALCNELRVYGQVSEGMRREIAEACRLGIPVVDAGTGVPLIEREPPR
jgi:dienelactone hydrolase